MAAAARRRAAAAAASEPTTTDADADQQPTSTASKRLDRERDERALRQHILAALSKLDDGATQAVAMEEFQFVLSPAGVRGAIIERMQAEHKSVAHLDLRPFDGWKAGVLLRCLKQQDLATWAKPSAWRAYAHLLSLLAMLQPSLAAARLRTLRALALRLVGDRDSNVRDAA